MPSPSYLEVGHKISAKSQRKGDVTGTITDISRAGKGMSFVNVTLSDGTPWRWKVRSLEYGGESPFTFVGKPGAKEKKLVEQHEEKKEEIADKKEERADAGIEVLRKLDLQPGDEVVIKYSNMTRSETVMGVNFKTGKVGIKRYRNTTDDSEFMDEVWALLGHRRKVPRNTRWLPATIIVSVKSRMKDSFSGEKTLPYKITPIIERGVEANGWYQQTYSNGEFQAASCVFAKTPAMARKGINYEVASKEVYHDPATGYFWRETGSFD